MAIPPAYKSVAVNIACDLKLLASSGILQSGRGNLREALSSTYDYTDIFPLFIPLGMM
jgi:hypothetical protein